MSEIEMEEFRKNKSNQRETKREGMATFRCKMAKPKMLGGIPACAVYFYQIPNICMHACAFHNPIPSNKHPFHIKSMVTVEKSLLKTYAPIS